MAIEIENLGLANRLAGWELGHVVVCLAHLLAIESCPGAVQRRHRRRRAGKTARAALKQIAETAVAVLALLDVVDGPIDRFLGHVNPCVMGSSQGQELRHRDGKIGIAGLGKITPAALLVLRLDDELYRQFDLLFDIVLGRGLLALGQEHQGEGMPVHGRRLVTVLGTDQPVFLHASQDVGEALRQGIAIGPLARLAAGGHHGAADESSHGNMPSVDIRAVGTVVVLAGGEEG